MKKVTVKDIMSFDPCFKYTKEKIKKIIGKGVNLKEALKLDIPPEDILWLVLRPEFIPEKELHTHACNFAEQALRKERESKREPHPDSWKAIKTKRAWIEGKVTDKELEIAREEIKATRVAWMSIESALELDCEAAWDVAVDASEVTWEEQLKYLQDYYK